MNILDKIYPEISIKIDAEDLKVIIDFLNECGMQLQPDQKVLKIKASVSLLKEIRDKFVIKHYTKKGTTKQFLIKLKAYHLFALLDVFALNDVVNGSKPFEKNCIVKYNNIFHQKLTGI
ncbi:hypothetical protein [Chryseobacterium sp.]|uniref:hypothetical protein n=1 Tax=Chryseobacterium sp. TaxID=1871047 RepID=UPI00289870E6|nr:hypothetical protein [Chryseobacterium sp.]